MNIPKTDSITHRILSVIFLRRQNSAELIYGNKLLKFQWDVVKINLLKKFSKSITWKSEERQQYLDHTFRYNLFHLIE
jgi:hypothetical protein